MAFVTSNRWSSGYAVAEYKDLQADAMALDMEGHTILLAGRRNLVIRNLNENVDVIAKRSRNHRYDTTAAEWNPNILNSNLCAITCNERVEIIHVRDASLTIPHRLNHHTRRVTDICWHRFERHLLASTSVDALTLVWDIREQRRPVVTFTAVAGANKVQWNKLSSHLLATAHDGDIRIWDQRKPTAPVQYIVAHAAMINGLDWSQTHEYQLATCSQDCSVRFFDMTNPRRAESILSALAPVWRARYAPWGEGLVTAIIPPRDHGDSSLLLWSLLNLSVPVHTFVGPSDIVLDFSWRRDNDYQLVTWCRDRSLRVWRIEPFLQQLCGCAPPDSSHDEVGDSAADAIALDTAMESATFTLGEPSASFRLKDELENLISGTSPPSLQFHQVDVENRSCVVVAQANHHKISLVISFPPAYPYNAAPSFQLDETSPLDQLLKTKLLKVLKQTAQQKVRRNRPCLESCLTQLVTTLEHTSQMQAVVGSRPDVSSSVNGKASSPVSVISDSSSAFSSFHDVYVPYPKSCGARFCSVGILVCFARPERVRIKPEMTRRSFSGASRFTAEDPDSPEQNGNRRLISRGSRNSRTKARLSAKFPRKISIYNLSKIFYVHKELGQSYQLNVKSDITSLCLQNADAVASSGLSRLDLVQTWTLASLAAGEPNEKIGSYDFNVPWSVHPFSNALIEQLIVHYAKMSDVQTAAMLAHIFPLNSENVLSKSVRDGVLTRYADMLLRWDLLDARTIITKSFQSPPNAPFELIQNLEYVTAECRKCSRTIVGPSRCTSCQCWALRCVICRVLVKGGSNLCMRCGHGGHADHMIAWFQNESICPSGCGCKCLQHCTLLFDDNNKIN